MANPAFSTRYKGRDGRLWIDVTENKTLAAEDSGLVQNVTAASVVVTLPATATVGSWTIRDGGVKGTSAANGAIASAARPTVDCNASDTVAGLNVEGTEADGKNLRVASATASEGDEITITNTGATDGGFINGAVKGDWEREA
jgi:hypothetical protein